MAEIDVALFAFDGNGQLRRIHQSGQKSIAPSSERLLGRSAADLG